MALMDMRTEVRDNIEDPGMLRWPDLKITNFLNEGQLKLQQFSRAVSPLSVAVPANTDFIARPATLLAPYKAFWNDGYNQWELTKNFGVPECPNTVQDLPDAVYYSGASVYIRPVPAGAGTLIITGTIRPVAMVNDADPVSYDGSDDTLVAYATWRCLLADGDPQAPGWYQIYLTNRAEWSSLDAEKYPSTNRLQRTVWDSD